MLDSPASKALILSESEPLREALSHQLEWNWDEYHQALLAEFSVDHEQAIFLTLLQHFPFQWDRKSIKKAPPLMRHRASRFAALNKSQRLLTQDDSGDQEVMIAWWPWGHGATISVRIFRADTSEMPEPSGLSKLFKKILP